MADRITEVVAEARAGEPSAWDQLFRRYQLPLYSYVFELLRNEQESLDVVQETFINAVRYLDGLREDGKFGSWLFGIAHQKCVQLWRKQNRRKQFEEPQSDDREESPSTFDENDPSELLLRKEQEEQFLALLEQLEPPHRAVLLLHFIEDFSLEQIAEITVTNHGTVKSRMHYAKRALRKLLEDQR